MLDTVLVSELLWNSDTLAPLEMDRGMGYMLAFWNFCAGEARWRYNDSGQVLLSNFW